ncbi:MAG: ROK family protein [Chloroflexi bacterium]|nr:ROK family protein [Chloroflexota bacterium]
MESSVLSIFNTIYASQPVTRRALSDITGLSPNRVGSLVSQLTGANLVLEDAPQDGTPGRPAALLSVNSRVAQVVGIDVGARHSRAVLTDAAGRVLTSAVHVTRTVPNRETIVQDLLNLIEEVCAAHGALYRLTALGIGIQGIVDTHTGSVLDWPSAPGWAEAWRGLHVVELLEEKLDVRPIIVDDSVRAMGETARRFGRAAGASNFLYVFLGNGIGSAVFADGRLYAGSHGIAGEVGHVTVDEEGPWCSCGNRGCLEVMASTAAVLRRARERLAEPRLMSALRDRFVNDELTLSTVIEAALTGDKVAFQILDETGTFVGKVLAIALNILGPELVVLGGPLAQAEEILLDAVERQVRLRALPHVWKQVSIICDDQGELAGAQGAALRALDTLFSSNTYLERIVPHVVTP